MKAIVGYTGFVGSNIYENGDFAGAYNTKNIAEAYGTKPELLVYAGLRAEKFLANSMPERDMQLIAEAERNIELINPQKLVLISTIDVFKTPLDVDENTELDESELQPYGYNRAQLEKHVREKYPDALIVRLPGLFGKNIKKNFIYDYIKRVPSMLKNDKFAKLCAIDGELAEYYAPLDNGFYKCRALDAAETVCLKAVLERVCFSALNFTDSRSSYQFYPLRRLYADISTALDNGLTLFHPATEPISAGELYEYLTGDSFVNELAAPPAEYDYKTVYSALFGRDDGYIMGKNEVMREIKAFTEAYK